MAELEVYQPYHITGGKAWTFNVTPDLDDDSGVVLDWLTEHDPDDWDIDECHTIEIHGHTYQVKVIDYRDVDWHAEGCKPWEWCD